MKYDYLIVGAGFAGAVLAERLAQDARKKVLVIDKRDHAGGNCYDYSDENGIIIQKYGPHIFHTKNKEVFDYLSGFTAWNGYRHKVIAFYKGQYYPIPINLDTINLFYGINLETEEELKKFLDSKKVRVDEIKNSEDVVVSKFGKELYEAFVKNYTKKQWDKYPHELDRSVLERLPIKYDKNPYFFPDDPYQGMPVGGFGKMFERMLEHENITVRLNVDYFCMNDRIEHDELIFTGRIDQFFGYNFGKLEYRCIDFTFVELDEEDHQPNTVVNHTGNDVEFSRVTEFKKFYGHNCKKTVLCKEFFNWDGELSYPVMTEKNFRLLEKYKNAAKKKKNTLFIGRLAQFEYLNMDNVVEEALEAYKTLQK